MQLLAGLGPLGAPELLIILVIVVLVFGVGRLGDVGGALGKGIKEFRTATKDDEHVTPSSSTASSGTMPVTMSTPADATTSASMPAAASADHMPASAPADAMPAAAPIASAMSGETMFCSECGARNLRSAKFCAECGRAINAAVS